MSNPYDTFYTIKSDKHPDPVMCGIFFSGEKSPGGISFLPKKETMHSGNYLDVLREPFQPFFVEHDGAIFMHYGAPCHMSKVIWEYLQTRDATCWLTRQLHRSSSNQELLELHEEKADYDPNDFSRSLKAGMEGLWHSLSTICWETSKIHGKASLGSLLVWRERWLNIDSICYK